MICVVLFVMWCFGNDRHCTTTPFVLLSVLRQMLPHEQIFSHPRRSFNVCSMPTWLTKTGPVLLKKHFRTSKYDPLVEVYLTESNPEYAYVRLPHCWETTVSTWALPFWIVLSFSLLVAQNYDTDSSDLHWSGT